MPIDQSSFYRECNECLGRYFAHHHDPAMQEEAVRILSMLKAHRQCFRGQPASLASGVVYTLANQYRRPCGIPGMLNADAEAFFGVSVNTIRRRAAQVEQAMMANTGRKSI